MFLKDNFLAQGGWVHVGLSPHIVPAACPPSPNPDAPWPVTSVKRSSSCSKARVSLGRGLLTPVLLTLTVQEPFASGASWGCASVSRYQLGRAGAHRCSPHTPSPGVGVSGEGAPLVPHLPAILVAHSIVQACCCFCIPPLCLQAASCH